MLGTLPLLFFSKRLCPEVLKYISISRVLTNSSSQLSTNLLNFLKLLFYVQIAEKISAVIQQKAD